MMLRRRSLTLTAAALALAISALTAAEVAYVTPHGKTYHTKRDCMALSRAATVYTTTPDAAKAHGLKPCGICNRPPAKKGTAKPDNGTWAKGGK